MKIEVLNTLPSAISDEFIAYVRFPETTDLETIRHDLIYQVLIAVDPENGDMIITDEWLCCHENDDDYTAILISNSDIEAVRAALLNDPYVITEYYSTLQSMDFVKLYDENGALDMRHVYNVDIDPCTSYITIDEPFIERSESGKIRVRHQNKTLSKEELYSDKRYKNLLDIYIAALDQYGNRSSDTYDSFDFGATTVWISGDSGYICKLRRSDK